MVSTEPQLVFAKHIVAVLLLCSLPVASSAQQSPTSANPPAAAGQQQSAAPTKSSTEQQTTETEKERGPLGVTVEKKTPEESQNKNGGTSNDRLFFALPNFLTLENAGKVPPLSTKEKFKVVARGSFDYVQYPWYGFLAGISQAEDSEPGYGQGAQGYGKRYGAAFADGTIENFMTGAVLPSVLRQDPRYFQLGHGGFMHRTVYAASRNLITRTDSGHSQFNYSEVVGGAISAAISTYSYHPSADRTVSNTASVWGTQYGYDTLTLVIKEFWPDIRRKIHHRPSAEAAPATTPQ
jgi:hypothetical protein